MKNTLPLILSTAALAISVVAIIHTYERSKVRPIYFGEIDIEPTTNATDSDKTNESPTA